MTLEDLFPHTEPTSPIIAGRFDNDVVYIWSASEPGRNVHRERQTLV